MSEPKNRILLAVDALQQGDRRGAAALLADELKAGPPTGERWNNVYRLATKIGEIDIGLEASRRFSMTQPLSLERIINHCGALAQAGRSDEAISLLDRLPAQAQGHPAMLHFRGTIASENGDFERAEAMFRKALAVNQGAPQSWFALTMIKTFKPGDPDFAAMKAIEPGVANVDPFTRARFYYGLGKASVDMGEIERGFDFYERGAAIRRRETPYYRAAAEHSAQAIISGFTAEAMAALTPSGFDGQRAIFVNGLPRSGTTLVESILAAHSRVGEGAEVNLLTPALIPTGDKLMHGALAYQRRYGGQDPWGEMARDYHHMLAMRFRGDGLVVDKTLSQSFLMGLLMHSMPDARVIWMRRNPEDVALSSYRSFFTQSVDWSWSFEDIAHQMKLEDQLFAHWRELYPERILVVPYEELVSAPDDWLPRLQRHAGLDEEEQVRDFHKSKRKVRTASVQQVRAPISTSAIGKSAKFAKQLEPFRNAYFG